MFLLLVDVLQEKNNTVKPKKMNIILMRLCILHQFVLLYEKLITQYDEQFSDCEKDSNWV